MHDQEGDKYAPSFRGCSLISSGTPLRRGKHQGSKNVGSKQSFKQLNIGIAIDLIIKP